MPVSNYRETRSHGFERGHVVTVFEFRIGRMDEEAVAAQDLLQLRPVVRWFDAGHVVVATYESHRNAAEGHLVKIPQKRAPPAPDAVGDAQTAGQVAPVRKIIARVRGKGHDVLIEPPRASFQFRYSDRVRAYQADELSDGAAEFVGLGHGLLIGDHSLESAVDHEQGGPGE